MKRIMVILICCSLIFLFLSYSGVFRDDSNPISVVNFYYQCLKNWEWFLSVSYYNSNTFNYMKEENDYIDKKMFMLRDVKLKITNEDADKADVSALLTFKDGRLINAVVNLIKVHNKWLINGVNYE